MIDKINRTRRQHIVTIEDPIEIIHPDRGCIVTQREVGLDAESFMQALRRVLRQDPDVILIGELRDKESAKAALQAAESGHFVLSTMHTVDATETIGRLVEFFPPGKQMTDPADPRGRSARCGQPAASAAPREGPAGRRRGDGEHCTDRRPDSRAGEDRGHPRRDRDGAYHHMQSFSQHEVLDFETAAVASTNRHDFEIAVEQALRRKQAADAKAAEAEAAGKTIEEAEAEEALGLRLAQS